MTPQRIFCLIVLSLATVAGGGRVAAAETKAGFYTSPAASVLIVGGSMMAGNQFSEATLPVMRGHFAGCKLVAMVLHASHPTERDAMEARMKKAFAHLGGMEAVSLHRFDDAGALNFLKKADAIWVGGGETFVLLGELQRTGQMEVIRARVLAGVPYGGSSAGANVAGLVIGTTNDFPVADVKSREALGIFPAVINPHHPKPDTKADFDARAGKIKGYVMFNPQETVLGLANAAIARWHGGRATIATGAGWIYRAGAMRELPVGEVVPELTALAVGK